MTATDFFYTSTLVLSDADPIDINAASVRAITLRAVLPSRQGLVLFSNAEQLLLYSELVSLHLLQLLYDLSLPFQMEP